MNLDVKTNTYKRNWGNKFLQLDFGNSLISYNTILKSTDWKHKQVQSYYRRKNILITTGNFQVFTEGILVVRSSGIKDI